jgi:hypothetical protein
VVQPAASAFREDRGDIIAAGCDDVLSSRSMKSNCSLPWSD